MPLITHSIAISADRDTTPDELTHWQANPAEFVFTLADGEDFTDVDSVSLELRKMGQTGATGLLARATASGMADADTEVTLSFTSAEMNQTVTSEYHTLFLWLYATAADTHTTLWKGTVKLYADETTASLTEQPPDVESWNLTEERAAALYATLASVALKAPLASPALTGVPTAPTAANGTNTTQLATTAFVIANAGGVTDGDKGDVTVSGATWAIDNNTVTNAKAADMATATIKGRRTAGTGDPEDLTVTQAKTLLSLENVTNTSDANKPVSTAQQTALDLKANLAGGIFTGPVTVDEDFFVTGGISTVGFEPSGQSSYGATSTFSYNATAASAHRTALGSDNADNLTSGTVGIARLVNTQTVGDADATITAGKRDILLTAALTAPRSYTWPLASAYPAGARVSFVDIANTLTATNTATIVRSGSDTLNGATSIVMSTSGASPFLISDGVSKWNLDIRGVARGGTGRTTSTTAYGLLAAGTTATGPQQTLAAGLTTEILVGGGASALPVWTSASGTGAPVRAASPTITGTLSTGLINSAQAALGTTPTDGVLISNGSFAATGAQQYSPSLSLSGDGFSTVGGRMPVKFSEYVVPVQVTGTAPTGLLTWESKVGGAAAVTRMTLDTSGSLSVTGSLSATAITGTGQLTNSAAGAASTPAVNITGAPYTAGTGTTNYPLIYANGGTAPTTWSSTGTYFGINAVSGFTGNLIDLRVNGGSSVFKVSNGGAVTCASIIASGVIVTTPNSLTGAGAISNTTPTTNYISNGAAQALTLLDGQNGQIKTIIHSADGGSGVLNPATKSGYTTITFNNVGDSVTLQFITGAGWCIIGIYGAVAA